MAALLKHPPSPEIIRPVPKKIVLATRKSPLALAQSGMVAAKLTAVLGAEIELWKIVTTGDKQAEWSLEKKGGKGLFTGELEEALLRKDAHIAVHSAKDLPGEMPAGLAIAGYLPRADVRDVLVIRPGLAVPKSAATGSPRRREQLALIYPGVNFSEIRGNVDTRLRKIADGLADATILAAAGLSRLGIQSWPGLEFHPFEPDQMVPAVAQGAIAVQCRADEVQLYSSAFDPDVARHVRMERAFQGALGGGCHTALGVHATDTTLYFYHQKTGRRQLPLSKVDYLDPEATVRRILASFGLNPAD